MSARPDPPLASTRSELRNLRHNSQATVEELKTFLRQLKGKSPQEMLGMVAGNQLFRATVQSFVLILIIIAVGTVVPYLRREAPAETAGEPAASAPDGTSTSFSTTEFAATIAPRCTTLRCSTMAALPTRTSSSIVQPSR